jgi:Tol biopolymer transport system component
MKRCPECRRDYYDETLLYCLDDGTALLEGPASGDRPATSKLSSIEGADNVATRAQVHTTGETAILPSERVDRTTPSGQVVSSKTKWEKRSLVLVLGAIGSAAIVLAVVAYRYFEKTPAPFQSIKITKLTSIGNATAAAMSPNGEYIAHILYEGGKNSVRIWDVATKSTIEIVPPTEDGMAVSTFSPDSRYVYYRRLTDLYQVPVLGGTPKKILENIIGGIGFSPDGKQSTFIRRDGDLGTSLFIANADGTGERTLATRKAGERFSIYEPAWSPDGKLIATGVYVDGTNMVVAAVSVDDGTVKNITSQTWVAVNRVAWTRDGRGLIFPAGEANTQSQIWYVSYPAGEARRITNDANSYGLGSLSLTSDSSTIATTQVEYISNVFVGPAGDLGHARQITHSLSSLARSYILSWTPEGKLIYSTSAGGNRNIWIMNADGTGNRQLTTGSAYDGGPVVTPDGRYIVFDSTRGGRDNIWRMDADGGHLIQLTNGADEEAPSVSPDGQWIIFDSIATSDMRKVSINGGEAVRLTERHVTWPTVSPRDGMIAGVYASDPNSQRRLAVFAPEGGEPIKTFDLPPGANGNLQWSADGRSILYVVTKASASSLWCQSLDGSPPKQLADFTPEAIFSIAAAPDGRLALARGTIVRDVVLITDTVGK